MSAWCVRPWVKVESRAVTRSRLVIASCAALALSAMGCGDDAAPGSMTTPDAGGPRPPRECPPGPNVCACADNGPPDLSRAEEGMATATSDDRQQAALIRTNYWRTAAGLPPVNADERLEQAATAHSTFMSQNPSSCWPGAHFENAGSCMGYTGRSPADRVTATGYRLSASSEVINWEPTPQRAIDGWIWTVYHRAPFQDPSYSEVGFAAVAGRPGDSRRFHNTMEFARPAGGSAQPQTDVSVFPPPGTTGAPTYFQGNLEGPTPPTPATGRWPSGTVISLMFHTNTFTITSHKLYDGQCQEVAHSTFRSSRLGDGVVADSQPDAQNGNPRFVFLYGDARLQTNTQYTVEVRGTVNGEAWSRVWAFTTSP